jgi:exopolysaccharide biosynthesis polyprenyl glycosylphosphotransferase
MNMSASESVTPRLYEILATSRKEMRGAPKLLFRRVLACAEILADFFTCAAGMFAACLIANSLHPGRQIDFSIRETTGAAVVVGLLAMLALQRDGAYRGGGSLLQVRETERAIRIPVQVVLMLLALCLLLDMRFSFEAVLIGVTLIPVLLIAQKMTFFSALRAIHAMGYGVEPAVVYGAAGAGRRVVTALLHSFRLGLRPVAVIDDDPALDGSCILEMGYRRRQSVPVRTGPITPEFLRACGGGLLIVALPNLSSERLAQAADAAEQVGLRVALLTGVGLKEQQCVQPVDIDGFSITPTSVPSAPWHYAFSKRVLDLILSSLLLVLTAPLFLLIAFFIRIDSPGPALFVQRRVGRNGRLFNIYKFRSMYVDAPGYEQSPASSRDPRITRIGRIIRQTSLDEFPQLINVLLGNMSLVGPRPEMPFIVQNYTSRQRQRLQVTPGITGLWQLSADRAFPIHHNIEYDLYYIQHRGIFMDIAILIHTIPFAVRRGV